MIYYTWHMHNFFNNICILHRSGSKQIHKDKVPKGQVDGSKQSNTHK